MLKYPLAMTTDGKKAKSSLKKMKPSKFLKSARKLHVGKGDRDIIDKFKKDIKAGEPMGPLKLYADGTEDGRHRATAAYELGVSSVPVIDERSEKAAGGALASDDPNRFMQDIMKFSFAILPLLRPGYLKEVPKQGFADGGHVLEDDYPTHYLPEVGRQVMADGGSPAPAAGGSRFAAIDPSMLVGTSTAPTSTLGAYTDVGGQKIAAPYVTSMRGGYPIHEEPVAAPEVKPVKKSPWAGTIFENLFGGNWLSSLYGYADGGEVEGEVGYAPADVEQALRVAQEAAGKKRPFEERRAEEGSDYLKPLLDMAAAAGTKAATSMMKWPEQITQPMRDVVSAGEMATGKKPYDEQEAVELATRLAGMAQTGAIAGSAPEGALRSGFSRSKYINPETLIPELEKAFGVPREELPSMGQYDLYSKIFNLLGEGVSSEDFIKLDKDIAKFIKSSLMPKPPTPRPGKDIPLIATHSFPNEALPFIEKRGGFAAPSLAIKGVDYPFPRYYGDIALVAPKEMVEPSESVKLYGGDTWTPMYPESMKTDPNVSLQEIFTEMQKQPTRHGPGEAGELRDVLRTLRSEYQTVPEMKSQAYKLRKNKADAAFEDELSDLYEWSADYFRKDIPYKERFPSFAKALANPSEINTYFAKSLPKSVRKRIESFASKFEEYGRPYFEAKVSRIVRPEEFQAGLVPTGQEGSAEMLKRLGIKDVHEYDPDNPASQVEAFQKLKHLFFADGGEVEGDVSYAPPDVEKALEVARAAQPREATMQAYEPTLREKIYGAVAGTSEARPTAERASFAHGIAELLGMTPVLGQAMQAQEAARSGDKKGVALAMLPMPGARAEKAAIDTAEQIAKRVTNPLGMHSEAAEVARSLPQQKGTIEQMLAMIKNKVHPEEIHWSGVEKAFQPGQKVTAEDLASHFESKLPQVQETVYGGGEANIFNPNRPLTPEFESYYDTFVENYADDYADSMFGQRYQDLPDHQAAQVDDAIREEAINTAREGGIYVHPPTDEGSGVLNYKTPRYSSESYNAPHGIGENYREVVLHHPVTTEASAFRESHHDEPNVIGHLRMSDRVGPNGEKILNIHEVQGDWGQKARERGVVTGNEESDRAALVKQQEEMQQRITDEVKQIKLEAARKYKEVGFDDKQVETLVESQSPVLTAQVARGEAGANEYLRLLEQNAQLYDDIKAVNTRLPAAPYATSREGQHNTPGWTDLLVKRILQEAEKGKYDRVIFDSGEEQAHRWRGAPKAAKGMLGYYNDILPRRIKKVAPEANMQKFEYGEGYIKPGFDVTPELLERVRKGLPAYRDGGEIEGDTELSEKGISAFRKGGKISSALDIVRRGDARLL